MPAGLSTPTGLCGTCVHASVKDTRRGTSYLRCLRSAWDERLAKYPPLPVLSCVGYDPPPEGRPVGSAPAQA